MTQVIHFEKTPSYEEIASENEMLKSEIVGLQSVLKDMIDKKMLAFVHNGFLVVACENEIAVRRNKGLEVLISDKEVRIYIKKPKPKPKENA